MIQRLTKPYPPREAALLAVPDLNRALRKAPATGAVARVFSMARKGSPSVPPSRRLGRPLSGPPASSRETMRVTALEHASLSRRQEAAWTRNGRMQGIARGHEIHNRTARILKRHKVKYNRSRYPDYRFYGGRVGVELKPFGRCGGIRNCTTYPRMR